MKKNREEKVLFFPQILNFSYLTIVICCKESMIYDKLLFIFSCLKKQSVQ